MYTAFFYTKGNKELFDTVKYYSNKYCIGLLEVNDLREMLLKGSNIDKYGLYVDTSTVDLSPDLINYMVDQGGNHRLLGILLIGDAAYTNDAVDNYKIHKVILGEGFSTDFVAKADSLNAYLNERTFSVAKISDEVHDYLIKSKLSTKYIGFSFIKDAIIYCLAKGGNVEKLTSSVYLYISEKHSAKISSIERNMRIAIDCCWRSCGNTMLGFDTKPSNKEFLSYSVSKLKSQVCDKM